MSKIRLYACGGAATNICSHFVKYAGKTNPGFSEIDCVFIDTSRSNLNPSIPKEMVYIVSDTLDGSGKLRSSNYEVLSEKSKEILLQHKASDVNLVVHSTSGGSGSTIGAIIVSELLARGETVIVLMVGSTGSRIETENTVKTLKSYEVISRKREMPVIAAYRENSIDKPRGSVDAEMQTFIVMLAAIFSGNNRELDMSDLRNFVNYNKVTSFTPKLSFLDFFSKEITLGKGETAISVVTLVDEKTPSDISIPVEYQAVGFMPDITRDNVSVELPLHVCVIAGHYNGVVERLDKKLASYAEARNVVVEKSIASRDEQSTDDGLVL